MLQVFADRELGTSTLIRWATELVDRGVLRNGFARFLWSLQEAQLENDVNDAHEMGPAMFVEILDSIGVTIPLPLDEVDEIDEDANSAVPPVEGIELEKGVVRDGSRHDGVDLLVIMRLPLEADAKTQRNLVLARTAAFPDSSGGNSGLQAVFEFDNAGAPHGLPERVMALCHKIGTLSPRARWRLGGVFRRLRDNASLVIMEYDKKRKTLCIEALGQSILHMRAMQFVISALYHVARDFPGASWTGWIGCGMSHDGEKMYLLATSSEKQVLIVADFAKLHAIGRDASLWQHMSVGQGTPREHPPKTTPCSRF